MPATIARPSAISEQDQDVDVAQRAPAPDREAADQRGEDEPDGADRGQLGREEARPCTTAAEDTVQRRMRRGYRSPCGPRWAHSRYPRAAMRILILGGDGYLGWPTAMRFSARGHEVSVVDNFSRRRWHVEHSTDSLTPIRSLAERIEAWREVSGQRDRAVRRASIEDGEFLDARGRRDRCPRRSSTTASSPRRRTR